MEGRQEFSSFFPKSFSQITRSLLSIYSSDDQVVSYSVRLWSGRLEFNSNRVKPITLKLLFTAFLLDAQH